MSEQKPFDGYQASFEAPGERRGMSGCAKVALIVVVLGFIAVLVSCVGGGYYFWNGVKQDPQQVRELGNDILECQFSDELDPLVGLDYFFVRCAIFGGPEKGTFMLVDSQFADAKEMGDQFEEGFTGEFESGQEGSEGLSEETKVIETEKIEVTIQGKKTEIQFDKAQGVESGKTYWQFFALLKGKQNPTFMAAKLLEENYSKEKIISVLEGIK